MGEKHSQSHYRAIGVHDARWVNSAYSNDSTATQDGAEPDQPVPGTGQTSFAQLQSHGTVNAGTTFAVETVKAGAPVGGSAGGRFVWRSDVDVDNNLGWLAYNKVTGFEHVLYHTPHGAGKAAAVGYRQPKVDHGVRRPCEFRISLRGA